MDPCETEQRFKICVAVRAKLEQKLPSTKGLYQNWYGWFRGQYVGLDLIVNPNDRLCQTLTDGGNVRGTLKVVLSTHLGHRRNCLQTPHIFISPMPNSREGLTIGMETCHTAVIELSSVRIQRIYIYTYMCGVEITNPSRCT